MATHRQHYVPQMYLKNFASNKMCYVLDMHEYNAKIIGNKANKYVISRDKETLKRYEYMWERRRDE